MTDCWPIKAEDADISYICKSMAKQNSKLVAEYIAPEQLGIGVQGGIDILLLGIQMSLEYEQQLFEANGVEQEDSFVIAAHWKFI